VARLHWTSDGRELGNGWTEGVHPDDYDRTLEAYARAFDARKAFELEYRLRRFDEEYRWILDHGVPRFSSSGTFHGYIGSCIDITERKEAETKREELAREQIARAAAEAANRSKDEILALVSHELRSPLTAILGYTRILRSGATFTVTLPSRRPEFIVRPNPAVTPREVRTEGAIELGQPPSLEGVDVLVVDDQEEAREALTHALGNYGARVAAVPSGADALALLSNPPGGRRPDTLILDIAMPAEDGYTVLKKVRALEDEQGRAKDRIPAIALTAYGRSEDRLRARAPGRLSHARRQAGRAS
jgi:CheY-like chemotaxis protein